MPSIIIISRRPYSPFNETEWSYRNRFSAENAAINATPGPRQEAELAKLTAEAEAMRGRWQGTEPHTEFRVIDEAKTPIRRINEDARGVTLAPSEFAERFPEEVA